MIKIFNVEEFLILWIPDIPVFKFIIVAFYRLSVYGIFCALEKINDVLLNVAGHPCGVLTICIADKVLVLIGEAAVFPETKTQTYHTLIFLPTFVFVQLARLYISVVFYMFGYDLVSAKVISQMIIRFRKTLWDYSLQGRYISHRHAYWEAQRLKHQPKLKQRCIQRMDCATQTNVHISPNESIMDEIFEQFPVDGAVERMRRPVPEPWIPPSSSSSTSNEWLMEDLVRQLRETTSEEDDGSRTSASLTSSNDGNTPNNYQNDKK